MGTDVTNPPALFEHCKSVYTEMRKRSEVVEKDDTHLRVYDGFLTKLFDDLRLSTPYFTSVMNELQRMDCVRKLRRGGGSATSQWLIMQEPTMSLWQERSSMPMPPRSKAVRLADDETKQMMLALKRRIDWLYEYLGVPERV